MKEEPQLMGPHAPLEMRTQGSRTLQAPSFTSVQISPSGPVLPIEVIPPRAKRNTINQRRCRARRQGYIEDLERRIRAYEAQGVQVTTEMQVAARKVAEENCALREEVKALREQNEALQRSLAEHSSGSPQMEDKVEADFPADGQRKIPRYGPTRKIRMFDGKTYTPGPLFTILPVPARQDDEAPMKPTGTKMAVSNTTMFSPRLPPLLPPLLASGPPPNTLKLPSIAAADRRAQDEHIRAPLVEEEDDASAFTPSPPPSNLATLDASDRSSTARHPYSPPSLARSPFEIKPRLCKPAGTANSTPCLEAAHIIASMRGVPSDDNKVETEILPELGCRGPLSRPTCISPEHCSEHGQGYSQRGLRNTRAIPASYRNRASLDISTCSVDNGKLFDILAREG